MSDLRDDDERFGLSTIQRRLWTQHEIGEARATYNGIAAADIAGDVDLARLRDSLARVVARHEILRTSFGAEQGGSQRVHPPFEPEIDLFETRGGDADETIDSVISDMLQRPFDLASPPLFRFALIRREHHQSTIVLCIHHIISDGWSLSRMVHEIGAFYDAASTVQDMPSAGRYRDFVERERAWLASAASDVEKDWWCERLSGATATRLPRDRDGVRGRDGEKTSVRLGSSLSDALMAWAANHRATPFMAMLAVVIRALRLRTGVDDVLLGVLTGFRETAQDENTLGCMINTLCVRTRDDGGDMDALLEELRGASLDAWEHRRMPYDEALGLIEGASGGVDGLDLLFVYQPPPAPVPNDPQGLAWQPRYATRHVPSLPLTLLVTQDRAGLVLNLEYDAAMFSAEHMLELGQHIRSVARTAVAPDAHQEPSGDRDDAIAVSPASTPITDNETIDALFEAIVATGPDRLALIEGGRRVSFRDVDAMANRLAVDLHEAGLADASEGRVVLFAERSVRSVAAWIAVLKAGGVVVSIPPDAPDARVAAIVGACRPLVILCEAHTRDAALAHAGTARIVSLDVVDAPLDDACPRAPRRVRHADSLAYMTLTSGSSGTPKLVMGTHRGIVNRLRWTWEALPFATDDIACHHISPAFVDVICEIFVPLCAGIPLWIVPGGTGASPDRLVHTVEAGEVSRVTLVPAMLEHLVDALEDDPGKAPRLRDVFVSGERLPGALAARFQRLERAGETLRLCNIYGSSEVSADATYALFHAGIPSESSPSASAGHAIGGCVFAVLDDRLEPCRPYVMGAVHVGGAGVNRGYAHAAGLTAEAFVPSVLGARGSRMYRTGDYGYVTSSGKLHVIGRLDRQVKRHGVRIELDELDEVLARFRDSAFATSVFDPSTARIRAFVEPISRTGEHAVEYDGMQVLTAQGLELDLWHWLTMQLPSTHLPDAVVLLERMPRLPSGKLDRRRLVRGDWDEVERATAIRAMPPGEEPVAGGTTATLVSMCETLFDKRIGADDRMLGAGMNSLMMVQLSHAIELEFHVRLGVADIYRCVTLQRCADRIDDESRRLLAIAMDLDYDGQQA